MEDGMEVHKKNSVEIKLSPEKVKAIIAEHLSEYGNINVPASAIKFLNLKGECHIFHDYEGDK